MTFRTDEIVVVRDDAIFVWIGVGCNDEGAMTFLVKEKDWARSFLAEKMKRKVDFSENKMGHIFFLKERRKQ